MNRSDPFGLAEEWLTAPPPDPRGRVTLVNFWTLTCINWLRQEPYVRAWWRAYRDDGLLVVGVHTPEFGFEHDVEAVRRAVAEREIDYPVAVDNDYGVWQTFDNRYWPALYFLDRDGAIRDSQFGEGRYDRSERVIQRLLGVEREPVPPVHGSGVEAPADWRHLRSPETYLGYYRSERFVAPDRAAFGRRERYERPERLRADQWALSGEWVIGPEAVLLAAAGGSIAYRFHARDVHLVLDGTAEPIPFRVSLDGAAPGAAHGVDVDADGRGVLREGRLYQLVRQPGPVRERTVEIHFEAPGAQAYAFTFG